MSNFMKVTISDKGVTASENSYESTTVEKGASEQPKSGVQVNTGYKMSLNTHDGTVRLHTPSNVNMGENHPSNDPLDSAVSPAGTPLARANVREDSLIPYKGLQVQGTQLLFMGVLQRTASGSLEWTPGHEPRGSVQRPQVDNGSQEHQSLEDILAAANEEEAKQQQESQDSEPVEKAMLSTESEALLAKADRVLGEAGLLSLTARVTSGDAIEATVEQIAQQLAAEPAQVHAAIQSVRTELREQLRSSLGLEEGELLGLEAWAMQHHPEEAKRAAREQVHRANLAPVRALLNKYLQSPDAYDPEALLNAELGEGISVTRAQDGTPLVKIGGVVMLIQDAIKAGAIRVTPQRKR
jgi:hypothetical protein